MAYERTWAFSYNNLYVPTSALDQTRYQMWALKAMLLGQLGGLTLGLWTTYSSCDGAGNFGNGDLVDHWGSSYTPAKIVRGTAGNAHSWYVLQSPLMNGVNFYLLITFDGSANNSGSLLMAKTPFVSGTNTNNPTSVDSWLIDSSNSIWNGGSSSGILNRFNMALSSVGDFVYFPVQAGQSQPGISSLSIAAVAPVNVNGGDGFPIWTYKLSLAFTPGGFSPTLYTATPNTRNAVGTAAQITIMGNADSSPILRYPDILTGNHMAMPCRVIVNTNTVWHLRGRLPDIKLIFTANAGSYPSSGITLRDGSNNVTHVLVGSLWIPCGSVVPIFS